MNKIWLQYLFYAGLLGISLGLQLFQPGMFAILCTPLPLDGLGLKTDGLQLPLGKPVVPMERVK